MLDLPSLVGLSFGASPYSPGQNVSAGPPDTIVVNGTTYQLLFGKDGQPLMGMDGQYLYGV